MKPITIILSLLSFLALITLSLIYSPPPAGETGVAHEIFANIMVGGDGEARTSPIQWRIVLFQICSLSVIASLIFLTFRKKHLTASIYICSSLLLGSTVFVWWMTWSSYVEFLETGETGYFGGFPIASAWMIYGTWFSGFLYAVYYVWGFRKFVYTEEDEAEFKKIVEQYAVKEEVR